MSTFSPFFWFSRRNRDRLPLRRPNLSVLASENPSRLPRLVRESAVTIRYLRLLGPLDWDHFPQQSGHSFSPGSIPLPLSALAAAYLVKLDQQRTYMSRLRQYLVEHPLLVWALGFHLVPSRHFSWGFDVEASLPTHRHLSRLLRSMPNAPLQFLLDSTVRLIQAELATEVDDFGQAISLDTKHILAWVQENNPKAYLKGSDRYNKTHQPKGDPDCRLGCKRKHNQRTSAHDPPLTPLTDAVPASTIAVGEYYWGYGSGVVATKVPGWGEIVLAESTQPFDCSDVSSFFPLMADVERRLGFRPRSGAFDAAFDAFYVYEYFDRDDDEAGFAAVPFSQKGGHKRSFSPDGLPLCKAGLPMPLKLTFISRTSCLVEHERGRHACPLLFPEPTGQACPIDHDRWPKGGCVTTLPTSIGARIRYQLDRESEAYKQLYKQRSATERVNSQAVDLGIERPKLRNGCSIANHNTLTYVLINLRTLQRIRQHKAERDGRCSALTPIL
jgi:hypothetical protein